jgi:hypothetical protein
MYCLALFLASLTFQDSYQEQVERCLADFKASLPSDESPGRSTSISALSDRLIKLGGGAIPIIARYLTDELRQGKPSEAAMGLFGAIKVHPEGGVPLRAALQNPSFSVAARIELATILIMLKDTTSWRVIVLDIVKNDHVKMDDRLRAAQLFTLPDEDVDLRSAFQTIAEQLIEYSEKDQRDVI